MCRKRFLIKPKALERFGCGFPTWRFMGSYKWGYKSPNMYSYPTYNPVYNYP